MTMKKTFAGRLIASLVLAIVFIVIAFSGCTTSSKTENSDGTQTTKILEGTVTFSDKTDKVKVTSGYVYSTDEVLLMEVHVVDYGIIKLTFDKSDEPDARGAYRYDIRADECKALVVNEVQPVTVTAQLLVTTTNEASYKVFEKTYTTANVWTPNY